MARFFAQFIGVLLFLLSGTQLAECQTILTFDDILAHQQNNTSDVIREEYAGLGVHFNRDGRHSGIVRLGLSQGDPGNWGLEGSNGPQFLGHNSFGRTGLIEFDMPIMNFKIDAARGHTGISNLTFQAYDTTGLLLESVTLPSSAPSAWTTINLLSNKISRIEYSSPENFSLDNMRFTPFSVPEPSTLALLGMSAFGLLAWAWRRNRKG